MEPTRVANLAHGHRRDSQTATKTIRVSALDFLVWEDEALGLARPGMRAPGRRPLLHSGRSIHAIDFGQLSTLCQGNP